MAKYTAVGSATYAYDADGNLIRKTDAGITTTLAYDSENHLTGTSAPGDACHTDRGSPAVILFLCKARDGRGTG